MRSRARRHPVVRQAMRLARGDRVRLTIPVPDLRPTARTSDSRSGRTAARSSASTTSGSRAAAGPADASALIVADPSSTFGSDGGRMAATDQAGSPVAHGDLPDAGRPAVVRTARPSAGFRARTVASADQLARLHVAARRRHRPGGVGATRRRAEERAAHMDRVRRRSDVRRRRPRRALPGRPAAVRRHRMARSAAISSAASTGRRPRPIARSGPRRRRSSDAQQAAGRRTGRCRRTARATGASSPRADSGCRFPASTACRPARICRS